MLFKTDILAKYLRTYSTAKPRSCFDSEVHNGYYLNFNHFHTFNNKNNFVLGLCIIEKSYTLSTESMLRIDFNTVEIHSSGTKHLYVEGTSFLDFCQDAGMSFEEAQLAYTLSKMVCIRIGSNVL